jgi:hypothetical protein
LDDEQDIQFDCSAICGGDLPQRMADNSDYVQVSYHGLETDASTIDTGSYAIQKPVAQKAPIIIIPGILASVLSLNNQVLWPNLEQMITDPQSKFMDALDIDQSGKPESANVQATDILGKINYPFGALDYSSGLLSELISQGYVVGQNLFIFPYDWRLGISTNAALLKIAVAQIYKNSGNLKIDFIAHSLGGLILKQFLIDNTDDNVDKAIFVATPELGSADAARQLIFGGNLGIPLLSEDEMQKLAQNMPSIYELLPSKEYFNRIAGYYDDLVNTQVKGILNYDQTKQMLENLGKNFSLLTEAENLHSAQFDNFDFSQKNFPVYNIVGCGTYTLKTINKMYASAPTLLQKLLHGPKYRIYGDTGDGTVLAASAAHLNIPQANTFYLHGIEHAKILSADAGKKLLAALLSGQQFSSVNVSSNIDNCGVEGKLLSLNSSLDINIIDAQTNQPIDPNLIQRIKIGEDVHLFFPTATAQKYKVIAKPKDNVQVKYDISVSKVNPVATTIYNYNQISIDNSAQIQIDDNNTNVQLADQQGNLSNVQPSEAFDQSALDNNLPVDVPATPAPATDQSQAQTSTPQQQSPAPILQYQLPNYPLLYTQPQQLLNSLYNAGQQAGISDANPAPNSAPNSALDNSNPASNNSTNNSDSASQKPDDLNNSTANSTDNTDNAVALPNNAALKTSTPNININLQIPNQQPKIVYLPANPKTTITEQDNSQQQNPALPQQTIIIESGEQSSIYWTLLSKLLHLMFF